MYFQKTISALTLAAAVLSSAACTKSHNTNSVTAEQASSIVNGRPVTATDAYAAFTVAVGPLEEPQCTGVVISAHHILSAGHCVEAIQGGVVFFGLDFASATVETRKIKTITAHPEYCEACTAGIGLGNTNDLAVVEFEGELPAGFTPIGFAARELIVKNVQAHLAGYGANENYDYETIMKVTQVPVAEIGLSEFNTDETKSGSCNGDSGGPAFIQHEGQWLLAGITSRGDSYCRRTGVYTIPVAHDAWIQSVIKAQAPTEPVVEEPTETQIAQVQ